MCVSHLNLLQFYNSILEAHTHLLLCLRVKNCDWCWFDCTKITTFHFSLPSFSVCFCVLISWRQNIIVTVIYSLDYNYNNILGLPVTLYLLSLFSILLLPFPDSAILELEKTLLDVTAKFHANNHNAITIVK